MTGEPGDATWWAEIEESLGHLDAAERAGAGIVPGPEGDDELLLLPAVTPGWRVLQPDPPRQRRKLRGLARWWAARQARR